MSRSPSSEDCLVISFVLLHAEAQRNGQGIPRRFCEVQTLNEQGWIGEDGEEGVDEDGGNRRPRLPELYFATVLINPEVKKSCQDEVTAFQSVD